jgi:voltage-gated potassium channel
VAFVIEFSLAASKSRFLRRNWITVIALVIPALRILRVFTALRVLRTARLARSVSIVRASTTVNRAARTVGDFLRVSQFAYALLLTALVTLVGAAGGYFLERGSDSQIDSFGDALWWSSTIVTTINSPLEAVTVEGRVVGMLLRIFGVTIIGYITARLAVYFLGRDRRDADAQDRELRAVRDELARLREQLERRA